MTHCEYPFAAQITAPEQLNVEEDTVDKGSGVGRRDTCPVFPDLCSAYQPIPMLSNIWRDVQIQAGPHFFTVKSDFPLVS